MMNKQNKTILAGGKLFATFDKQGHVVSAVFIKAHAGASLGIYNAKTTIGKAGRDSFKVFRLVKRGGSGSYTRTVSPSCTAKTSPGHAWATTGAHKNAIINISFCIKWI